MSGHIVAVVVAVLVLIAIIVTAGRILLMPPGRHSRTRHEPGAHSSAEAVRDRNTEQWLHEAHTVQLSSFDRQSYMESEERMAEAFEHQMFMIAEDQWAKDIRAIFADAARIEADLLSGRLAFPEWIWRSNSAQHHLASAVR